MIKLINETAIKIYDQNSNGLLREYLVLMAIPNLSIIVPMS